MAEPSETTGLLSEHNDEDDTATPTPGQDENVETSQVPPHPAPGPMISYFRRPIKIINDVLLVFSAPTFVLLVTSFIMIQVGPFSRRYSSLMEVIPFISICMFFALLLSAINVSTRPRPPAILENPILDILFASFLLIQAPILGSQIWSGTSDWCDVWRYDYEKERSILLPPTKECLNMRLATRIMMAVAFAGTLVVGLSHLTLLILRTIAAFKSRFWEGDSAFTLPAGSITFEFSIKVRGRERTTTTTALAAEGSGATA